MKIIGLSGGIACGKNFVASVFAKNGAAIFDADKEVHQLLELDKSTFAQVKENFSSAVINNKIDRKKLGEIVFADAKKLEILEKIIHPKVQKKYQEFLAKTRAEGFKIAVLNIPLLLETNSYKCDFIVAILLSPSIQKRRFFARVKKSNKEISNKEIEKKFLQITSKQLVNKERKAKADFFIYTKFKKENVVRQIKKIAAKLIIIDKSF